MNTIVEHDFGKERRDIVRKFARLMGLVEAREAKVLEDPLPFLEEAGDKIVELSLAIRDAQDALRPTMSFAFDTDPRPSFPETWTVDKREWRRLQKAARLLQAIKA